MLNLFSRPSAPAPDTVPLSDTTLIIDVRSAGEFASGHVPGTINIPLDRLTTEIGRRVPDKSTPVLLCCLSGARSGAACQLMQQLGYQKVSNGGGVAQVALKLGRPLQRG